MSHEPECPWTTRDPHFGYCICDLLRAAYRRGYNAHAASAAHWEATHGAYQQHGTGTNP